MRISEIPHVEHGRIAVCSCRATFKIDDATVVEELSLPDLPPPEYIDRFRILRYLGRGAMNCVYEGIHPDLGVHTAIKTLLPEYAEDRPSRDQFLHAAKIYAKAVHPNIVKVYETGKDANGVPFLVMEFLPGGTLADRMTEGVFFPAKEAAEIGASVCRALTVTEKLGIVHRDIKPDNIMISAKGQYKLTDLGLAKFDPGAGNTARVLDERISAPASVRTSFGTLEYMSPEQYIDAETCDIRSDIYSLGVTMYQLASGRLPFEPQTRSELRYMHLSVEPLVPSTFRPEIPLDFDYIVMRCIQKRPEDRYQTPEELLADLEAFLAGKPLPSTTSGAVPVIHAPDHSQPGRAKLRRSWILPVTAAMLVLLILVAIALLIRMERAKAGQRIIQPQPKTDSAGNFSTEIGPSAKEPSIVSTHPSTKALDGDIRIGTDGNDVQASSYFDEAKDMAAQALREGFGYKKAIDNLEYFTTSDECSVKALELISELKTASDAAVRELMEKLDGKAAPLKEAHEWAGAANVYRTDIGPLAPESWEYRERRIREIEQHMQDDTAKTEDSPQERSPQP